MSNDKIPLGPSAVKNKINNAKPIIPARILKHPGPSTPPPDEAGGPVYIQLLQ